MSEDAIPTFLETCAELLGPGGVLLPSEDLEKTFLAESKAAGMSGLKGHRSVGGIRASIYNAFPAAGCDALAAFMDEFAKTHG